MSARFITFEGGEGAGKSTQAALLAARLRDHGRDVVLTREPGGTPGAEAIRSLVVEGEPDRWEAATEALLVNAARADHVARLIRPALARGAWVVCDRFVDSTLAYQGAGKGLPAAELLETHRLATGNLWPDLTLVLDLPVAIGAARAGARGHLDRFERTGGDFHDRVADSFRHVAHQEPDRVRLIDASGTPDEVAAAVWREVERLLPC
jgi:dTMP kinase